MKKLNIKIVLLVSALFLMSTFSFGQRRKVKLQKVEYDIVAFPDISISTAITDVYIWVYNSNLQFAKLDTVFAGRYQINVEIDDANGKGILTRDSTFSAYALHYAETINQKKRHVHKFRFHLLPDKYKFKLRIKDLNSGKSFFEKTTKAINPIDKNELGVSDILILSSDHKNFNIDEVIPPAHVSLEQNIYLYANVYVPKSIREINVSVYQKQKGKKMLQSKTLKVASPLTTIFLEWDKEKMSSGSCELILEISANKLNKKKTKTLEIFGNISSLSLKNIDEMVEQLKYVARGKEWKEIKNANDKEKMKLFQDFWAHRNVSKNTQGNALFNEYYQRVEMANEQYRSGKVAGWKTDRGHVYILYGAPDQIEKNSDPMNSIASYEVWYYQNFNKKFMFFDEYGFGDYKLVSGRIE